MSEESKTTDTAASSDAGAEQSAPQSAPAATKQLEGPKDAFVRGGTTTSRNDQMFAALWQDAEKRRNQEANARGLGQTPLEQGGGVMFEHPLSGKGQADLPRAWLLLTYLTPRGEVMTDGNGRPVQCLADFVMGLDNDTMVIIVCPKCIARGMHQDQAQIMVRNSNRRFHFIAAKGSPTFTFEGMLFHNAGMIESSEKFVCPNCSWTARIDKNRVWPDN